MVFREFILWLINHYKTMPEKFETYQKSKVEKPKKMKIYEQPKVKKLEKGESEAYVFESFHNLGFKIEDMPELYERLIELSSIEKSHFKDAVHMALMVDEIWADLESRAGITLNKKELKLSCLFHDIGKSGPVNADRTQRRLIQMLFNSKYFSPNSEGFKDKGSPKDITIEQALKSETQISKEDKEKIIEYLGTLSVHIYNPENKKAKSQKLDIKSHKMIDFWREHDYWTWDLLKEHGNDQVTDEVKKVASTHHALEGHDPAAVDGFIRDENITLELLDKYLMITLLDKYQAWIGRAGLDHEKAIIKLTEQIEESFKAEIINEDIRNRFLRYLQIIKDHDMTKYRNM